MKFTPLLLMLIVGQVRGEDYAGFLSGCLPQKDIKFLNEIGSLFENHLIREKGDSVHIARSYQEFVTQATSMSLPPSFFAESKLMDFLMANKENETFGKIWIYHDGTYSTDVRATYFECLKNSVSKETIAEALQTIERVPAINPRVIAGALSQNLDPEDYRSNEVKLFVAVHVYSELALNLNDRFKSNGYDE